MELQTMKATAETIDKFKTILQRDPHSKVFAALAEAYRELGMLPEAEKTAQDGIRRHPQYVGGYLTMGRVMIDQEDLESAQPMLKKATELDPQNILAHQLLATVYLRLQKPKEALRSFKRVLFLNPFDKKSKTAIEKLESLTADEYESDLFTMKPLKPQQDNEPSISPAIDNPEELERALSLSDALMVRGDLNGARKILENIQRRQPDPEKYASRWSLLEVQPEPEVADPILPLQSREKSIREKKIQVLEHLLQKIRLITTPEL